MCGHLHTYTPSSFLSPLSFLFSRTIILTSASKTLEPREATEQSQARTSLLTPIQASFPVPATEHPSLSHQVQQLSKPSTPSQPLPFRTKASPCEEPQGQDVVLSKEEQGTDGNDPSSAWSEVQKGRDPNPQSLTRPWCKAHSAVSRYLNQGPPLTFGGVHLETT